MTEYIMYIILGLLIGYFLAHIRYAFILWKQDKKEYLENKKWIEEFRKMRRKND